MRELVERGMKSAEPWLIEIRRDIHAHPELGFDTRRTAAVVARELTSLSLRPQEGVWPYGGGR